MGFELGRLVREAAGELGSMLAAKARDLRRRAHAQAGRVLHGVGEMLRGQLATALDAQRGEAPARREVNAAIGVRTRVLIETMAEVLSRSGYRAVRADLRGGCAPDVVHGTLRSHRPSLSAVGGGRTVLLDVYLPDETSEDEQFSRWQLFTSAAAQAGGEFHVVVPSWIDGTPGKLWVRDLTDGTGISITKVWEV